MIIVGTVHIDIDGPSRLMNILEKYRPNTLTVEAPSSVSIDDALEFIRKEKSIAISEIHNSVLPNSLKKIALENVFSLKYELSTAVEFAKRNNSKLYFVDHPDLILQKGFDLDDFIKGAKLTPEKIDYMNKTPYDASRLDYVKYIDTAYFDHKLAKKIFNSLTQEQREEIQKRMGMILSKEFAEIREQGMTDRIIKYNPEMHIVGMEHAFSYEEETLPVTQLFKRLAMNGIPLQRIRLCEPDKVYDSL